MRRLALLLAVVAAATAGVARGDGNAVALTLPSAQFPNGPTLVLPASWTAPPAQPAQLSYAQLLDLWKRAGQAYGVPWNVLAAINKIESDFGRNMGPSSAGAIGWMQFMPSTWLRWGTDADGDGIADPWNPVDAVYSAARYLAAAGAASDIRQAVFAYNHATWYVDEVMQLAQLYGQSADPATATTTAPQQEPAGQQVVFALDRLGVQIDDAKASVTQASETYNAALATAEELARQTQGVIDRATTAPLLSDRLLAQKQAAQLGYDSDAAQAQADRLRAELDAAQAKLEHLQQQAQSASFNRPAAQVLSAPVQQPQSSGNYVFPVGGGPDVVSVSHFHHDYPAADIAAPEGSPLYALSDGTVLYAWSSDARCGTGFTMRTSDGQTWTYCHLSYMYPSVQPGTALTAGAPVGLVGATGHATGPHLHLQLQPASSYPQEQQWFQSFAGVAFRWQEDGDTKAGAGSFAGPVFTIVQQPSD
jgi:murein DD-endopeptidase MepM/ murein hydrolase activator NlpD